MATFIGIVDGRVGLIEREDRGEPQVYGVVGSAHCRGVVFSKPEADAVVNCINSGGDVRSMLASMGRDKQE